MFSDLQKKRLCMCVLSKARQAEGGREAEVTGAGAKARARVREGKSCQQRTAAPGTSAPACGGTLHIVTRLFVTGFILQ